MTKASLEAYIKGVENGTIDNARADVFRYIKKRPLCSTIELYNNLGHEISTISGRITELLDHGFIKVTGVLDEYSIYDVVSDEKEKDKLSYQRKLKRKEKAIKQLLKHDLEPDTIEALIREIEVNL